MCVAAAKTPANLPKKYIHMVKEETANISIFRRSQFFHTKQIREQDVLHAERIQSVCVCTM